MHGSLLHTFNYEKTLADEETEPFTDALGLGKVKDVLF